MERLLGVPTVAYQNRRVTQVPAAAAVILEANPKRIEFAIWVLGAASAYFALTPDVSATRGIPLAGNGGNMQATWQEDGELVTREWYGVSPAGPSTAYILEVTSE